LEVPPVPISKFVASEGAVTGVKVTPVFFTPVCRSEELEVIVTPVMVESFKSHEALAKSPSSQHSPVMVSDTPAPAQPPDSNDATVEYARAVVA
jgi:hypothetical protein